MASLKPDEPLVDAYERLVNRSDIDDDVETGDGQVRIDKDDDEGGRIGVDVGILIVLQLHGQIIIYLLSRMAFSAQSLQLFNLWFVSMVFWNMFSIVSFFHLVWTYSMKKSIVEHLQDIFVVSIVWDLTIISSVGAALYGLI